MAKNIIVCCDGTNNKFGSANTNVVRLYQCLQLGPGSTQAAYYHPGVGTLAAPGILTKLGQWCSRVAGLAIGVGILPDMERVIRFLMANYEPGDRIYMFGFSRGAYTVRMVAGMLRKCGLPRLGNDGLLPYMRLLYKIRESNRQMTADDVSPEFKRTFGVVPCRVHFLGLWDTVSTVGAVWNPDAFPFTFENDEVDTVRHAISVNERRGFFRTNRWGAPLHLPNPPGGVQDIVQWWFPGVHSDVGGGYPTGELWKHPLEWMANEAVAKGMGVDLVALATMLGANKPQWSGSQMHNSLSFWWWLLGIVPKKAKKMVRGRWQTSFRFSFPKWREVRPNEPLHRSVIERWRDDREYRPKNLDPAIMDRLVLQLTPHTESLPYV